MALGASPSGGRPLVTRHLLAESRLRLAVLVAEDNPTNQKLAAKLLEKLGHNADVAADGRNAVAMWGKGRYDVILMDVQMPEMDGFEATAAIRAAESASGGRIPIVAMTAHAMAGDRQRCLDAGMDDYVSKPIRPDDVDRVLRRWGSKRASAAAAAEAPVAPTTAAEAGGPKLDLAGAIEVVGGDRAFLAQLYREFLAALPGQIKDLEAALDAGGSDVARKAAHTIKGAAGNLGASALARAAFDAEQSAAGGDLAAAQAAAKRMELSAGEIPRLLSEAGLEVKR
jgi:CheY-like chemotaxis protein